MTDILVDLLVYAWYTFMGAFWIWNAIGSFKSERYFWFGFEVMMVCYHIGLMFDFIFKT